MTEKFPAELKYSKEHEWIKVDGNIATIGITHHAQDQLGDVVFVDFPPIGKELKPMDEFGVVESVKSVSSLYCPVSGKVVEVNKELDKSPQLANNDPYGKGWMIKVEMGDPGELDSLLSAEEYQKTLA